MTEQHADPKSPAHSCGCKRANAEQRALVGSSAARQASANGICVFVSEFSWSMSIAQT